MAILLPLAVWAAEALGGPQSGPQPGPQPGPAKALFAGSDRCMACHNGLVTSSGVDVSIGTDWRASMMANAARDPYWQAAVRREVLDHPEAQAAIENECAACHMPMARYEAKSAGRHQEVFSHLPIALAASRSQGLAADGVSCSLCHQISADGLGEPRSFTAGFEVDTGQPWGLRQIFGPFAVDAGRQRIMSSAAELRPSQAAHIQSSELCATCHTLYTHALAPGGEAFERLPEQVPYLEWRHSDYREQQSCQSCHMPVENEALPITSVLGEARAGFSRHVFRGGNFFMLRLLQRHHAELGLAALPEELTATAQQTEENLQTRAARIKIEPASMTGDRLGFSVTIENLAGHKLPSAYPSRRAWLHVTVRGAGGELLFESGALTDGGAIAANDNDADPSRYEPHYEEIDSPEQVQIYEPILGDPAGGVTTGLLTAVRYLKDNRLLPRGFDKPSAEPDIAVRGAAAHDPDFAGGGDTVRFRVAVGPAAAPFTIETELWYQTIGYRWAQNLRAYQAEETQRFIRLYEPMSNSSALLLAKHQISAP